MTEPVENASGNRMEHTIPGIAFRRDRAPRRPFGAMVALGAPHTDSVAPVAPKRDAGTGGPTFGRLMPEKPRPPLDQPKQGQGNDSRYGLDPQNPPVGGGGAA